jgi:methylenetetrahydrofolate reductase (NADPH)
LPAPRRLPTSGSDITGLLARPRYEVIPLEGAEESVPEHVPTEVKVTVTTSPRKGLEPTLALAERLSGHGYTVVPHLAARHVRDLGHLREIVERLRSAGATDVLVMAGDAPEPEGPYEGALPLLKALVELGNPFADVGITGYPESHAFISDQATINAMFEKEKYGTYIVSQICFDPEVTAAWVAAVWERGTHLPIYIGIPGPVSRIKLIRISSKIGVGDSIRFIRSHSSWLGHTVRGDFDPEPLVTGLARSVHGGNVAGFHVFTFNELEATEAWRQRTLEPVHMD